MLTLDSRDSKFSFLVVARDYYFSYNPLFHLLIIFSRVHRYDQILRLRIHRGWLQYIWAATWRRTGSVWDTWATFDIAYPRYWWEAWRRWGFSGRHRFHYGRSHHWHSIYWIHMDQWRRRWMNFKILINTGHWWVPSISYPWGGKYHWCASRVIVSVNRDQWVGLGCNGWTT